MHRNTLPLLALLALPVALLAPAESHAGGFDRQAFEAWVRMRAGDDGKPVYWYATGDVMDQATGEVRARIEGLDTSLAYRDPTRPDTWIQLSRKIFILLDPKTGKRQLGRDGKPRPPTAYPFQVRSYRLDGDEIVYDVESHDSARVFTEPTKRNFTARRLGRLTHYNYAMFIDRVRVDGNRTQRFEVNDFFLRADPGLQEPERYQYTWVGTGPGPTVSSVLSWRYSSFDAMPGEALKKFVREEAPLWLRPPKDMAEIEALRGQQPWRGPGSAVAGATTAGPGATPAAAPPTS
ncbi:MAG: hypothetical protein MUF07_00080 [Steroidobacteraceae bacterium]|jgi:hypothetical protein|nr:hypothetical protein [Steroidobacteraceae bacterium]